jgi:hypothetical protein
VRKLIKILSIEDNYRKAPGNNPILKMHFPNHLRMGRFNKRALDGPMRILKNKQEQLEVIRKNYYL